MEGKKQPLRADRIRRLPKEGWSWIDRRFLRDKAPELDRDSILLYFFLAAVADRHGLSFFGDSAIAGRLRMTESSLERARSELERRDLIAYAKPLYQVLSIPCSEPLTPRHESGPVLIQDFFCELAERLSGKSKEAP